MSWWYWFLILHLIWVYFMKWFIGRLYDVHIQSHELVSKEIREKYHPFVRNDVSKINKWVMIIYSIYIFPIRCTIGTSLFILSIIWLAWLFLGVDPDQP